MAKAEVTLKISPTDLEIIREAIEAYHDEYADIITDAPHDSEEWKQASRIVNSTADLMRDLRG